MQTSSDFSPADLPSPAFDAPDRLLSLDDAAQLLGVSKTTLRRWTRDGILASVRINPRGDRRFLPQQIEDFLRPRITGSPQY